MTRTTLDIDGPVLEDLKRIGQRERKNLGRTASDLLAEAISRYGDDKRKPRRFRWIDRPMSAKVDLADKEAVRAAADRDFLPKSPKRRS